VAGDLRELEASLARFCVGTVDERTREGTADGTSPLPEGLASSPVRDEEPHALASRWVHGEAVDWRALHGEVPPARVAAPTYPFERLRYWFDGEVAPSSERKPRSNGIAEGPWERITVPNAGEHTPEKRS
jgi:acyl transferase domain-containing protein